jgi:hypothetical protein
VAAKAVGRAQTLLTGRPTQVTRQWQLAISLLLLSSRLPFSVAL